ncbi:MAG: type VI secretion system contractile sheath large subunit [Planctomyces sp.]|nr:type VI secretion system contractile sheath large subunit [Planctomyces sp.]
MPKSSGAAASPGSAPPRDAPAASASLLEDILQQAGALTAADGRWRQFHAARDAGSQLRAIFGRALPSDPARIVELLNRLVAEIDVLLNGQINAILHAPELQALEATWRGLRYLADSIDPEQEGDVRIRVWNCSRRELVRDLERAVEFDQSQLFQKVYEEEFGTPGGTPYGLLIADYQFTNHPGDVDLLEKLSQVAAAAFAPCVAGAAPGLFDLESFSQLERIGSFDATFDRANYVRWRALRESSDARFISLAMPRILMRAPHPETTTRTDGFVFREDVSAPNREGFLWGNAAWGFGNVAIRAFQSAGWLASVRGVQPGQRTGGLVDPPRIYWFESDAAGVAPRCITEVVITEHQDRMLSECGIMPLCSLPGAGHAAFYSTQSLQKARTYDTPEATLNAKMSGMFQYMLCVSQFARYIKTMARDYVGAFTEVEDLQRRLSNWLVKYVTLDDDASPSSKARFPLRQGRILLKPHADRPGSYVCTIHLQPHYELDDLSAAVQLTTELSGQRQ